MSSLKPQCSQEKVTPAKILLSTALLLGTFPALAKGAADQIGFRETAQQSGDENVFVPATLRPSRHSAREPGTGVSGVRATVATSSWVQDTQFAQPAVPSPPSPPSLSQSRRQRRLPPSSPPLWCLQPGGGSDPQQLTQRRHSLSYSSRTQHGPRGGFAAPQRRRRRQPQRLSTAPLTTATTAQNPENPSLPTVSDSRAPSSHLRDKLKLRQQLWRARGGGRSR